MLVSDDEVQQLKSSVSCAVVLERMAPVWRLDVKASSRHSLKYRRNKGEIVIVNHDGRGWWDPLSDAKGDVFTLVQRLEPGLDFGAAKRMLQQFVGMMPEFPKHIGSSHDHVALPVPIVQRWARRPSLTQGSPAWLYLTLQRALAADILLIAARAEAIREGPAASAWFAHRDEANEVTGIEMRGPEWRGFSSGGEKTLFRIGFGPDPARRIAVCEGAIDALSLAAIEAMRQDTLYTATTGGMGPGNTVALQRLLVPLAADPTAVLIAATDADSAGCRHADRLAELTKEIGIRFERMLPPDGLNDWNDHLRALRASA